MEESVETIHAHLRQEVVLEVELQSYPEGLLEDLKATPEIRDVQRAENTLIIQVVSGSDVRARISQRIGELGGLLIGMHQQESSLEEAFVQITKENISRLDTQLGSNQEKYDEAKG